MAKISPDTEGFLGDFLIEARDLVDSIETALLEMESAPAKARPALLEAIQRGLHTLKGNAGMMGLGEMQELAHALEDRADEIDLDAPVVADLLSGLDRFRAQLDALEPGADAALGSSVEAAHAGVRVSFSHLDALVEDLAEMVIFRNRLEEAVARGRALAEGRRGRELWEGVSRAQSELGTTLERIRDEVMELRVVPLESLFGSLRRIVHDESHRLGKQVAFEAEGGETPIDRALLEFASEALGHLVRNALVHGIETPEERRAAGKAETGTVRLSARMVSGEVRIDVEDDGAGVDRDAVVAAATDRGIAAEAAGDPLSLLFLPGLSTRYKTDLSSGRGMGLTAVREAVKRRGGRIEVESRPGRLTRFRLTLPSRVSIAWALLLRADGEDYALPMSSVVESLSLEAGGGHLVNNAGIFRWRDSVLPLLDLGAAFDTSSRLRDQGFVVVMELEGRFRGLVVDELIGVREVVVKDLDPVLGSPSGVLGSTILGDGRAILILDPMSLMSVSPFLEKSA